MPLLASGAQRESKMYHVLLLSSYGTLGILLSRLRSQPSCCPAEQAGMLSGFIHSHSLLAFLSSVLLERSDCTPHLDLTLAHVVDSVTLAQTL